MGLPHVFINKVLLKYGDAHLVTYFQWLFCASMAGLVVVAETIWLTNLKYFPSGYLQKKQFADSWFKGPKEELAKERGGEWPLKQTSFLHQLELAHCSEDGSGARSHLRALAGLSSRQALSLSQLLVPKASVARCWLSFSEGPSWAGTMRLLWGSVLQGQK